VESGGVALLSTAHTPGRCPVPTGYGSHTWAVPSANWVRLTHLALQSANPTLGRKSPKTAEIPQIRGPKMDPQNPGFRTKPTHFSHLPLPNQPKTFFLDFPPLKMQAGRGGYPPNPQSPTLNPQPRTVAGWGKDEVVPYVLPPDEVCNTQ